MIHENHKMFSGIGKSFHADPVGTPQVILEIKAKHLIDITCLGSVKCDLQYLFTNPGIP